MATNPPFQVEDQTDEDFFDKLVNDEDDVDFGATAASSSLNTMEPAFTDGNESDDIRAIANLSLNEVSNSEVNDSNVGVDDLGGELEVQPNEKVRVDDEVKGEVGVEGVVEEKNSVLESQNSFEFSSVVQANSQNVGAELLSDTTLSKASGSGALGGVKEVQWSAFAADSAQNDANGFGSYSDFFTELVENAGDSSENVMDSFGTQTEALPANQVHDSAYLENSDYGKYQEGYDSGVGVQQSVDSQDLNSSQYWESQYPGWKFDLTTGQWYQVDDFDMGTNLQGNVDPTSASNWAASDKKTEVSYLQQSVQSAVGTVADSSTTESVTNWKQVSQQNDVSGSNWNQAAQVSDTSVSASNWNQGSSVNNGYPSHMVFYPEYPGYIYDTIANEWRELHTYNSSSQSTVQAEDQLTQNGFASTDIIAQSDSQNTVDAYAQVGSYSSQGFSAQGHDYKWGGSFGNHNQQDSNMWQHETVAKSKSAPDYGHNQQLQSQYGQNFSRSDHVSQQIPKDYGGAVPFYEKTRKSQNDFSAVAGHQGFVPSGNFSQQYNQPRVEQNEHNVVSNDYFGNQNSVNFPQQQFHGAHQISYAPTSGRSSAGRPSHALVKFGFGGKLIVAKSSSLGASSFGSQNPVGSSISVLNLMEVVMESADTSGVGLGAYDYFRTLCRQSFPGPLIGGSGGTKELIRWIDERIGNSESPDMDYRKGEVLKLLLSLLKLSCHYYGKLRSPFGSDTVLKETDAPETAVARLFASAKRNGTQFNEYHAISHCLQNLPSEGQMRATAVEVQSLLVSGKKREALHCAQEGQLWGPALVLAAQLGDQFYVETVKQMALRQLVAGSPLRTLCLLIAGQPADVFSMDALANSSMPVAVNINQQPTQFGANVMLDDWEENLAVITANRTKDDELVLIHFGDCLWKDKSDVLAAHICYLVAEANFEPYSDTSRLCLVGADHMKFPRTYASPEAIQRTEVYEYSKVLGNSQFVLLPFQPYKFVYAHMLAEVGRISDAQKYCQLVLKSLKTGRAPEVETLRQSVSSLEERLKTHQQGGFSANLAPGKLMGKLFNLLDSTAHRVVGGLPPPVPSTSGGSIPGTEHYQQMGPRVSTSQSTMAMSSLMPSASMEPISEWATDSSRMTMHNRSVSEPDFGRSPRQDQVDSSKEASTTNSQGEISGGGGTSRFGRFGFGSQLFQKTVGLVLKPRQGRQAKLGETNKFYYDEKLKRWVEEGAELPTEETALPPPPTTTSFPNGMSDYNLKTALKSDSMVSNGSPEFKSPAVDHSSGIPPLPPTSNQFSARGRMGVRSRYVDTFNQGGGNQTNLFHSPSIPSAKPATTANPKFFVPTPVSPVEERIDNTANSMQGTSANDDNLSAIGNDPLQSSAPSSTMQRFGSMGSISSKETTGNGNFSAPSRRTASWSGSFDGNFSPPTKGEVKPLGEVLGMPPSTFMPSDSSLMHSSTNGGSFGDDLHEVEL